MAKLAGMMLYLDFLEYEVNYLEFDSSKKEEKIKEFKLKLEFFLLNVYPDKERHAMFVSDFNKEEDKIECIRKWISSLKDEILFLFTPEQIDKAQKFQENEIRYGISGKIPFISGYIERKIKNQKKS